MQTLADSSAAAQLALARELRLMRDLSGRSLKQLEGLTFVSDSSLSRYLSGRLLAPWSVVVALCRLVRRDPAALRELWDRASEPQAPTAIAHLLPRDVPDFTGRADAVRFLLDGAAGGVDAIDGMAGVGKTTLAVHIAHRLAARYPDGQFFLDLHGHTPGRDPLEPAEAIRGLLALAGVPARDVPDTDDSAAALWRATISRRRVLLVLDNAASASQVSALLPDDGDCRVIITSRQRLVDLHGARPVPVDVLSEADATELFARALGMADDGDHDEVVGLCGYLPLGIRLAAARLRHRPTWTTQHLAQLLRDEQRRLPALEVGEQGVASAFGLSYRRIAAEHRRMFRLLGLVPGDTVDRYAAASLAGVTVGTAEELLEDLVDAHLVQQPSPDRYRLHDLLRQYARETAVTTDPAPDRDAAIRRLLDYYVHTAAIAAGHLSTQVWPIEPVAEPPGPIPLINDSAAALAWFDLEVANLTAAVHYAGAARHDRSACDLCQLMFGYLQARGWPRDHIKLVRIGLAAASRLGDDVARIRLHRTAGILRVHAGDRAGGRSELEGALRLARTTGDAHAEVVLLHNLGFIDFAASDYAAALPAYEQAAALRRRYGPAGGNAMPIAVLGFVMAMLGRAEEADMFSREALALSGQGDEYPQTQCHHTLGILALRAERLTEAEDHFTRMLDLARETGHRGFEAHAHGLLANVQLRRGEQPTHLELAEATAQHTEMIDVFIVNLRGYVHLAAGRQPEAITCFQATLDEALTTNSRYVEAHARRGLGAALATTDPAAAQAQRASADKLFAELGIPEPADYP
jgi:tetratricopeptide (TPR) repeat protein